MNSLWKPIRHLALGCQALVLVCCCAGLAYGLKRAVNRDTQAAKTPEQAEVEMLNRQVVQLYKEKRYKEALPHAERALKLSEKAYGPEHAQTAKPLTNLAAVQSALNEHGDAARSYGRLLKLLEAQHGAESAIVHEALSKLGWEELLNGDMGAAEKQFKRGLELREKTYGAEGREVIAALNDLAMLKQRAGKTRESIDYFQRIIALQEKHLGKDHLDVGETLIKTAALLRLVDRKAEADTYEARAREIAALHPADQTIKASGGVLQGQAAFRLQPAYPDDAKRSRVSGKVEVQVTIDEAGIVIEAIPISGPKELRGASVEAARQWRFKPTKLEGRPVKVQGVLTFNFHLQ